MTQFGYRPQLSKGPPPVPVVPRERIYGDPAPALPRPRRYRRPPAVLAIPLTRVRDQDKDMNAIAVEVAAKHGFSVAEMRGPWRNHDLVACRHEAWWRIRTELNLSYPRIGKFFLKDHTTIVNGISRHERRVAVIASSSARQ